MLKWGPLQAFDSTIIFGVLCILIMGMELIMQPDQLSKIWRWPSLFVFLILMLSVLSLSYTSSYAYCYKKILQFVLTVAAFYYPQSVLKSEDHPLLVNYIKGFLLIAVATLLFFYISFGYTFLPLIILATDGTTSIPNYLVLSAFLVIALLYLINKNSIFDIILKLLAVFLLFQLGGRGPIIILVAILFLDYMLLNFRMKRLLVFIAGLLLTISVIFFLDLDLSNNRSLSRFRSLNSGNDKSLDERIRLINASFNIIEDNTMFGTGIGSFGQEAKGKDGKAYPHNLFLEVGSELGFFGLLFTFLFLISVIWSAFKFLFTRKDLFVKYKGAVYVSFFLFLENLKSNSFFENKILFGAIGILLLLTQSLNEKDSELNSKK
ncbi:MAG: hypothetical protein RL138_953 [Bacteroidota bacterium]